MIWDSFRYFNDVFDPLIRGSFREVQYCDYESHIIVSEFKLVSLHIPGVVDGKTIYNTSPVYDTSQSRLTVAPRVKRLLTLGAKPAG
jgi:hypothetical protein